MPILLRAAGLMIAGTAHAGGFDCDSAVDAQGLVINELLVNPEGIEPGLQWIELYNETGLDLDASGWRIEAGTAAYDTWSELPLGTFLIDGEYVVVAQSALPFADLVRAGFEAGPASADADAVRIVDCGGSPVDTVVYGASNPDGWKDDSSDVATSLAPAVLSGQPLARVPDGDDTNASAVDFSLVSSPTPGSSNEEPPLDCGGPGSGLLVNEVFDDGVTAWVELLHTGTVPVLLGGWAIAAGGTSMEPVYTFADGNVASPGSRIVVGEVPEAVYPADLSFAGVTAIRMVDCLGFGSDTLVIGPDNLMDWVDDAGTVAVGLAPPLQPAMSLARLPDGSDTNDASVDFILVAPTPATENELAPPGPDTASDTASPPADTGLPADTDAPVDPGGGDATAGDGCGCAPGGSSGGSWVFAVAALLVRRRPLSTGRASPRRC